MVHKSDEKTGGKIEQAHHHHIKIADEAWNKLIIMSKRDGVEAGAVLAPLVEKAYEEWVQRELKDIHGRRSKTK